MNKQTEKALWFRLGTEISFSEAELSIIQKGGVDAASAEEQRAATELLAQKLLSGGFRITGETYVPQSCCTDSPDESHQEDELNFELELEIPKWEIPETQIKVMIVDDIVEDVLSNTDVPLEVEILRCGRDYSDYEQMKQYQDELWKDPAFKTCSPTFASFGGDDFECRYSCEACDLNGFCERQEHMDNEEDSE